MVFLSMGHERPVRGPETIAFWRYFVRKKKRKREEAVYFQMHRYILEFYYKSKWKQHYTSKKDEQVWICDNTRLICKLLWGCSN